MKQATLTATDHPVIAPAPSREPGGDPLDDFFNGWRDSVAPQLSRAKPSNLRVRRPGYLKLMVSSTDMVRVNRATVRESSAHRHWPPEVVAQFLQAEVIRTRSKSNRS